MGADIGLTGGSRYPSRAPRTVGVDVAGGAAIGHRSHRVRSSAWETTAGTTKLSMAELTRVAAERYGDAEAARYQRDGAWQTLTFRELWARVRRRRAAA